MFKLYNFPGYIQLLFILDLAFRFKSQRELPWTRKAPRMARTKVAAIPAFSIEPETIRKKTVKAKVPVTTPRRTRRAAAAPEKAWVKAPTMLAKRGKGVSRPLKPGPRRAALSVRIKTNSVATTMRAAISQRGGVATGTGWLSRGNEGKTMDRTRRTSRKDGSRGSVNCSRKKVEAKKTAQPDSRQIGQGSPRESQL